MENHIVKAYDAELSRLNSRVSAMGSACEWQLAKALKSLENKDARLAEEVIKEDENLNTLYLELEEEAVQLLAKRTPMAGDLRFLVTVMRAGSTLERIGDYASGIARRVKDLCSYGVFPEESADLIQTIGVLCRRMISDVIKAFVESDVAAAIEIWNRDDEVDRKFARLMTGLREKMHQDQAMVDPCTAMIFMGRCLERIGDHITNIAEGINYVETGETCISKIGSGA